MPDLLKYHESLTDELHALKDRVRNLVEHWPTDGEFKEAALRTTLRRHFPESLRIGRGFVVSESESSSQIDLLVVDGTKPTLFRDGDLMIVTPDSVAAVVEVKTSLSTTGDVSECVTKLAKIGKMCCAGGGRLPWLGVFSYEGPLQNSDLLLDGFETAYSATGVAVNCLAYGKDRIVRYWNSGEQERGDSESEAAIGRWRAYRVDHFAPAYFIGNLLAATAGLGKVNSFAWFPHVDGKRVYMEAQRPSE